MEVYEHVRTMDGVRSAAVAETRTSIAGSPTVHSLDMELTLSDWSLDSEDVATHAVAIAFRTDPGLADEDLINVTVRRRWDLLIASGNASVSFRRTPGQWQGALARQRGT